EELVFLAVGGARAAGGYGVDVAAADVGDAVGQAGQAVLREVDRVGELPGFLILGVEVRPVGVGQPDRTAAVARAAGVLVPAVVVANVAAAALVGQREGVRADCVGGGQAPDAVLVVGDVVLGVVAVEVEGQRVAGDRHHVVQVEVLA